MLGLNPLNARTPLPLSALPPDVALSQRSRTFQGYADGRCSCGSRPMSVRLHMRSGQRPQFEGNWHCGKLCLQRAIAACVRREFRSGHSGESRVRHRIPIGLLLQTRGVITADELRRALVLQEQAGARLGDILVRHFRVDERSIASALAAQWNAPLWHLPSVPSQELLRLAPLPLFRRSGTLPFRLIGTRVSLATADGLDPPIALALERMHGVAVESGFAVASSLDAAWTTLSASAPLPVEEVRCDDADDLTRRMIKTISTLQPVQSRAVRIGCRMWLRLWLEPAAVRGGPCHQNDIVDSLFVLPSADHTTLPSRPTRGLAL